MDPAFLAAVTSGTMWGVVPALYTEASRNGGSVRANLCKSVGALLFLLPLGYATGILFMPPLMGLALIAANASLGTGLGDYSFLRSIGMIGPGKATSIVFTYLIWTAILSNLILGEILNLPIIMGIVLALAGIWTISYGSGKWELAGISLSLFASFCYTLAPIVAKFALEYVSPINMTLWNALITALAYLALSHPKYRVRGMNKALLGGLLGTGVAMPLYFYALSIKGVTITALATAIGPPASQISSHLSGNRVTVRDVAGSILITIGLVLSAIS